jgi:RND family efflux transporter MFP subunit
MKVLVAILAISTCVASGSAVYLSAIRANVLPPAQAPAAVSNTPATAGVPATPHKPAGPIELGGRLTAAAEFAVRATATGSVLHARVDPGDFVQRGQTLIELENLSVDESVRRAELALEQAKSDLEAQQARRSNIEQQQMSPSGRFAGRGAGGLARFARSDEQQARARLAQAEAALANARHAQNSAQIVAPVTGFVAERRVSIGDPITPGMEVAKVQDISTLKMTVDMAQADAAPAVDPSANAALMTFDDVPGRQFLGRVVYSLGGSLLGDHANSVTVEVRNPDNVLKPGMAAHVRLVSESTAEVAVGNSGHYGSMRRNATSLDEGPSDGELLRDVLTGLKGLAVTLSAAADAQTKELTRKQEATKVTVEATGQYLSVVEHQVTDLRPDNASHHAVSLEKAADEIDNLPILHVDEELVAFGAEVAQSLRGMAERRRSISRSRANADVTVSDETQVENSAIRTQGMQRITVGLANMRRKMTKKYNLEFLANAEKLRPANKARHTARR